MTAAPPCRSSRPVSVAVTCTYTQATGSARTSGAASAQRVPLGRLCGPEEVASVIAFRASPDAAYVTDQTIAINGGLTIRGKGSSRSSGSDQRIGRRLLAQTTQRKRCQNLQLDQSAIDDRRNLQGGSGKPSELTARRRLRPAELDVVRATLDRGRLTHARVGRRRQSGRLTDSGNVESLTSSLAIG